MSQINMPLFPLNIVLYPGMLLPLHIFEPRYKTMIKKCLEDETPFGVILIDEGDAEGGPMAIPRSIGTTAKIIQVQHLADEQMNLWTIGEDRFELLDYVLTEDEYLIGQIRKLEESRPDRLLLVEQLNILEETFHAYLELIITLSDQDIDELDYSLSQDPNTLSYQIASMLDIDLEEKQHLLELDRVETRLNQEMEILNREMDELENLIKVQTYIQEQLKAQDHSQTQELPWGGEVNLN